LTTKTVTKSFLKTKKLMSSLDLGTKTNSQERELNKLEFDYFESDEETTILTEGLYSNSRSKFTFYYEEPHTHIKNKPFLLWIFVGCWNDKKNRLTSDELWSFCQLREDASINFDANSDDFNNLLRELYRLLTNNTITEIFNEKWKDFGFQNSNPRSDFRAGGLLALLQLTSFAKSYNKRIKFMIASANEFLLAISSIYITHFLVNYYHLSNLKLSKKNYKDYCSRTALKSFCKLLEQDSGILNQIHHLLLNDLYDTWQSIRRQVQGITLLDFGMAQEIVKKKFIKITQTRSYSNFDSMSKTYLKTEIKLPRKKPNSSS